MILLAPTSTDFPRISANQLGEFVFASEAKKKAILRDQKFGNISAAPYYCQALAAVRRAFSGGHFSPQLLREAAQVLENCEADTARKVKKLENNAYALRCLAEISGRSALPPGHHRSVTKNAILELDGVKISVLPEYVTENLEEGYIAFTKLRFSKSKIALEVSEIVLLALHHYGIKQARTGLHFDFGLSKVVDCFSKTVIHGHELARHRDQQFHEALSVIRWMWPRIEPKE